MLKYYRLILVTSCLFFLMISAPSLAPAKPGAKLDYRHLMREFVIGLSKHAKAKNKSFVVIPQNGNELVNVKDDPTTPPALNYLKAIDGMGRESLNFGSPTDDKKTPKNETAWTLNFLNLGKKHGKVNLVTDYCSTPKKMDTSYALNDKLGFVGFAANDRGLGKIPSYPKTPVHENKDNVTNLKQVKNFLYLLNPDAFKTKANFISKLKQTNYDLLLIDLFFHEAAFTRAELNSLKTKANGGKRMVIAYMSIGEAEDYRYYWQKTWKTTPPAWMEKPNPDWPGNLKVKYWDKGWQKIIYGTSAAYLDRIVAAGFDGVYLDIIDAYWYFLEKDKNL
jgi:cysteinyl-tRNA synthetase, unknown class